MVWGHSWLSDAWNYVQGSGLSLTNQEGGGGDFKKEEKGKGKRVRNDVQMTNWQLQIWSSQTILSEMMTR